MNRPSLQRLAILSLAPLVSLAPAWAQGDTYRTRLLDSYGATDFASYGNLAAWNDHAFVCRDARPEVAVLDVSDPSQIDHLYDLRLPFPNDRSVVRDVAVGPSASDPFRSLLFCALDSQSADACAIYDVTHPSSPVLLTLIEGAPMAHVAYRSDGWLALARGNFGEVLLFDLGDYNPSNAPARIQGHDHRYNVGDFSLGGITLTDELLFISRIDRALVYDAALLTPSVKPPLLGAVLGAQTNDVAVTPDGAWFLTCERRSEGAVRLYEVLDEGGAKSFVARDSWVYPVVDFSSSGPRAAVARGDRFYVAGNEYGALAFQLDRGAGRLELVARFNDGPGDQSLRNFAIAPEFGARNVLATSAGLYTLDFRALALSSPEERPELVPPFTPTSARIKIAGLGRALDATSGLLRARVDDGPWIESALTDEGDNRYAADLPSAPCGARIDYYFAVEDTQGTRYTLPVDAEAAQPVLFRTFAAGGLVPVFEDDFELDRGWTVENDPALVEGAWERGPSVRTYYQAGTDSPTDAGDSCFATANGPAGEFVLDVDGGPTRLLSPILDFSQGDGLVRYALYQASSDHDASDALEVDVSSDGGSSWTRVEEVALRCGGWRNRAFRLSDHVTPSANVRLRFSIADEPNNSAVEAAVDHVRADLFCRDPLATSTFWNGGGSNRDCLDAEPIVLGTTWQPVVEHEGHAGATLTSISIYQRSDSGRMLAGGELLVDVTSPRFLVSVQPATGTSDVHPHEVPGDLAYAGLTCTAQGAVLGGGYALCNAAELVIGF